MEGKNRKERQMKRGKERCRDKIGRRGRKEGERKKGEGRGGEK